MTMNDNGLKPLISSAERAILCHSLPLNVIRNYSDKSEHQFCRQSGGELSLANQRRD